MTTSKVLVHADALIEAGKPEGELIVVKAALERDPSSAKLKSRLKILLKLTDPHTMLEASRAPKAAALKKLLLAGRDPNQSVEGTSLLGAAAFRARADAVDLLLAHGADPRGLESDGGTALQRALCARPNIGDVELGQRVRISEALIAAGADVHVRDRYERTVFWLALNLARGKAKGLIRTLLAHKPDLRARDNEGFSILHMAARWNHLEVLKKTLAAGADVQAYYGDKQGTALTLAIFSGHLEAVDLLLAAGANPNVYEKYRTPLARAVLARELALAKKLVAKGADVNWLKQELASGRMTAITGKWLTQVMEALS